jgi:hypothetical protein
MLPPSGSFRILVLLPGIRNLVLGGLHLSKPGKLCQARLRRGSAYVASRSCWRHERDTGRSAPFLDEAGRGRSLCPGAQGELPPQTSCRPGPASVRSGSRSARPSLEARCLTADGCARPWIRGGIGATWGLSDLRRALEFPMLRHAHRGHRNWRCWHLHGGMAAARRASRHFF